MDIVHSLFYKMNNFWFRLVICVFLVFSYIATYKLGVFAEKIGWLEDQVLQQGGK